MRGAVNRLLPALALAALAVLGGCDSDDDGIAGAVYAMTNAAEANEIVAYERRGDGSLRLIGRFATGGQGSGPDPNFPADPLASQEALILSADHRHLYAVNAGSDTISALQVRGDGSLELAATVNSGGDFPVSLALHQDLLYVLNGGGAGNISGFRLSAGLPAALAGSTRPLSGAATPLPDNAVLPATVAFSPGGEFLVVTEKASNLIDVYLVDQDGLPGDPIPQTSAVPTPFGAVFDFNGFLISSEANANGNMPVQDGSALSSYALAGDGTLTPVTAGAPTLQTAACWVEMSADNRYAYTTNTFSGTISGFSLSGSGELVALNPDDGITADLGENSIPLEMAFADRYLYVLAAGPGEVRAYQLSADGSLLALPGATVAGLPGATAEGLAAF